MIPLHEADKPHTYAYVAGCRNVAWIVGKICTIDHAKKMLTLVRDGEEEIPIYLEKKDELSSDLQPGQQVKLICHIYSGHTDDNEDARSSRYVRLVAKFIGRPSYLDMRPTEDFANFDLNEESLFEKFDLDDMYTSASNNIEIAGFVDGRAFFSKDQNETNSRLIFMIRQSDKPNMLIPVEIRGKHAAMYRKAVTIGSAVYVTGSIQPVKQVDTNLWIATIQSNHVRKAVPNKDFKFETVPDWVVLIRKRWASLMQKEKERQAALQAARDAEALAKSMNDPSAMSLRA